jgi:soluble P-type ATPase
MKESYIVLETPEKYSRSFAHLLLDYTGTLSRDGVLLPGVQERLQELSETIHVCVLTADTFGTAVDQLRCVPQLEVRIIARGEDKATVVRSLGAEEVIAIGNGRNDCAMFRIAGLSIAVIGPEGAAAELIQAADIITTDIRDALDLLLNPLRLKATLRE